MRRTKQKLKFGINTGTNTSINATEDGDTPGDTHGSTTGSTKLPKTKLKQHPATKKPITVQAVKQTQATQH